MSARHEHEFPAFLEMNVGGPVNEVLRQPWRSRRRSPCCTGRPPCRRLETSRWRSRRREVSHVVVEPSRGRTVCPDSASARSVDSDRPRQFTIHHLDRGDSIDSGRCGRPRRRADRRTHRRSAGTGQGPERPVGRACRHLKRHAGAAPPDCRPPPRVCADPPVGPASVFSRQPATPGQAAGEQDLGRLRHRGEGAPRPAPPQAVVDDEGKRRRGRRKVPLRVNRLLTSGPVGTG